MLQLSVFVCHSEETRPKRVPLLRARFLHGSDIGVTRLVRISWVPVGEHENGALVARAPYLGHAGSAARCAGVAA